METMRTTWTRFGSIKPVKQEWFKKLEPAFGIKATTLDNYFQISNCSDKVWKLVAEVCAKYPDIKITNLTCIRGVDEDVLVTLLAKLVSKEKKEKSGSYTLQLLQKNCLSFKIRQNIKINIFKILAENNYKYNSWEELMQSPFSSFFQPSALQQWDISFSKPGKKFIVPESFKNWTLSQIRSRQSKLHRNDQEEHLTANGLTWQVLQEDALNFSVDKGMLDVSIVIADIPYGLQLQKWDTSDWAEPEVLNCRIKQVSFFSHGSMSNILSSFFKIYI